MSTQVVVLGAGFGGLELAVQLTESPSDEVRVTLIDQNDSFVFGFSKLDVMFGRERPQDVRSYYRDIAREGVEFRQERVTAIDPVERSVVTEEDSYEADVLVVALGADLHPAATPGFVEGGFEFYSVAGAERLRDVLPTFDAGVAVIGVLGTPFKCPPAPCEAAFLLHDYLTERGKRDAVEIRVFCPFSSPVPVSAATSEAILGGFAERGIEFVPGQRVVKLDAAAKLAKLDGGESAPYDLFLGIPVHRVPAAVEAAGLAAGDGWVPVDQTNLATRFPNVYAVGDVTGAPVPKAGVFAETSARAVAEDILARIRGSEPPPPYDGAGSCYIEFGGGAVGRVDANFLSGPTPSGPLFGPSRELVAEKETFASSRRQRWFNA